MQQISRLFALILLIMGLSTCSSGPGKGLDYNGSYMGTLQGSPLGTISLEVSGSTITGTITVEESSRFRGQGDAPHSTFTGVRNGREVSISALINLETDLGEPPVVNWQDISTTLVFTARFADSGILIGTFFGGNPLKPNNPFSGGWSVQKTGSVGSSITKPTS